MQTQPIALPDADRVRHVIFDLDGTLIDHFTTIYRCYCHAIEKMGLPVASYETVRATVGGSVPVTMARLIGETKAAEAVTYYHEYFAKIELEGVHPMPGMRWLVDGLHALGKTLAVFTNKEGAPSRRIIAHLGLDTHFGAVFGTRDTPWRKPQPEATAHVLTALEARPETTVLIGDSPFDIAAAAVGSVASLVVATGSHTAAELSVAEPSPSAVYPTFYELGAQYFKLTPPPEEQRERLEDIPMPAS
ncbi:MAG: HAD family hydrolase [Opitutales bacterium]